MTISFGGAQVRRPGAYSTVDTTAMVPKSLGSFRVLAVVGPLGTDATLTTGGVYYFNSPKDANEQIGSGDSIEAMNVCWQHGADLIAFVPVMGSGTEGAVQDTDWQTALDMLETEFVDGIVPVTTAGAIQTKVDTHCTSMSGTSNRKERRAFYGHASGLTVTAIAALTTALKSERALLASPAVYVLDNANAKVLKDSVLLAAAYAGLWASKEPQDPITYDYVKFAGLEKAYKGTEIETLLEAGVAPAEVVRGKGFRIVQGITTSGSEDLTQKELSVSTLKDTMSRAIREYFEDKYVGKAGVAGIEVTIYNDLVSLIEGFQTSGWISGYVKESIQVHKNGTAFKLDWEGEPTLPINNFLITSHFKL